MMANDPAATATSGEQRLRARQRAFIRYCAIALVAAFGAGIGSGYIGGLVADGRLPVWLIYITSALFAIGFAWFTRDYLKRIDELDLMDNLWAALFGFFFYFTAFPIWNSLAAFELAPAVDNWLLWIATTIVMFAAYCLRKLGLR